MSQFMVAPRTLKLLLLELAMPPQLDFLLYGLDKIRPPGNDTPVPEEMLVETRRLFADIRRLLALGYPETLADPVGAHTRAELRSKLLNALELLLLMDESRRSDQVEERRNARRERLLQSKAMTLSPRPFPRLR